MASTGISRIRGLDPSVAIKAPCKVATTAAITLSGEQTIDGVVVTTGDRVLVKDQADATENGIYNVSTAGWQRAKDFNGNRDVVQGTKVSIQQGSTYANVFFQVTTADPIVINSSLISFSSFPLLSDNPVASNVTDMIAGQTIGGQTISHTVGQRWSSGATTWEVISTPVSDISDFKHLNNVYFEDFGAVADDSTNNSAALTALIATGLPFTVKKGLYSFEDPVVFTGDRSEIKFEEGARFTWRGATSADAFTFTSCAYSTFSNMFFVDGTIGVDALIKLDTCSRCSFYKLKASGDSTQTQGNAMVVDGISIINDFYSIRFLGLYNGIKYVGQSIANFFYGSMIEQMKLSSVQVTNTSTVVSNGFYGGVMEANTGAAGFLIENIPINFIIQGVYFEINDIDIEIKNVATNNDAIKVIACRFQGTTGGRGIYLNGPTTVIAEDNTYNVTLVEIGDSTAEYIGKGNTSQLPSPPAEILNTASSTKVLRNHFTSSYQNFDNCRGIQLDGYRVPVVQSGSVSALGAGSSTTVVFATQFRNVPKVFVGVKVSTGVTTVITDGINLAQVTFRNRGSNSVDFNWMAFDDLDLN